jgi:hypothetical protein
MTFSPSTSAIAFFCKDLRDAREFRQISLDEAAQITRISREYLEALENGRWDGIPAAYLRGYLGSYADAVGMNREKVLRGFDHLNSPGTSFHGAVLDETQPLLKQPEHRSVTRSKIRTTWFAELSHNRTAFYLLTFFAVLGLLGLLHLSRTPRPTAVTLIPFETAIKENQIRTHSPLTVIPLQISAESEHLATGYESWARWIGLKDGRVVIHRDSDPPIEVRFGAYDTIKIQYLTEMSGKVSPRGCMVVLDDTARVAAVQTAKGDTDIYNVKLPKSVSSDSVTIYPVRM